MLKIAVVTPTTSQVNVKWALWLVQLLKSKKAEFSLYTSKHYKIDEARNLAVLSAFAINPDYILFLDSDILPFVATKEGKLVPDPNLIDAMISLNCPVVAGYYYTSKLLPSSYVKKGDHYEPVKLEVFTDKIHWVDATGLGFCLVDRKVFDLIDLPYFSYQTKYIEKEGKLKVEEISEDISFFMKLNEKGIRVAVPGWLVCKHIHNFAIVPTKEGFVLEQI